VKNKLKVTALLIDEGGIIDMSIENIQVEVNENFKIELKENITTGYRWAIAQMPPNIIFIDAYYEPAYPGSIGGGGIRTFIFGAISPGQGVIKLVKVRAWELSKVVEEVNYHVAVGNQSM
jgi:predicted secreted protein